jgi:two-component system OmpR family response regulator
MSKRILVADDDAHIRDVIGFAHEKAGMQVRQAEDGRRALDAFRAQPCDLIVLDINMPEFDGLEVCREIRKHSDVPILFLSSRDDEIDRILGLEIGGDDYVTKPFSPRELVARVNVILRRVQAAPKADAPAPPLRHGRLCVFVEQHKV